MPFATGAQSYISYIKEASWGTKVLAAPAYTKISKSSESLVLDKGTIESASIRSDRNVAFLGKDLASVSGPTTHEIIYKELDDFLESVFFSPWSANTIKNGVIQKSVSIERGYTDINQFALYLGLVANTMSLSADLGKIATIDLAWIGKSEEIAVQDQPTIQSGTFGTITGIGTTPMIVKNASIVEGGIALGTVTKLDCKIENNLTAIQVLDSPLAAKAIGVGRCTVEGTLELLLEDMVMYQKFVSGLKSSLVFVMEEENSGILTQNSYTFTFPNIEYKGGSITTENEGEIINTMPFQALYDSGSGCSIQLDRADKTDA